MAYQFLKTVGAIMVAMLLIGGLWMGYQKVAGNQLSISGSSSGSGSGSDTPTIKVQSTSCEIAPSLLVSSVELYNNDVAAPDTFAYRVKGQPGYKTGIPGTSVAAATGGFKRGDVVQILTESNSTATGWYGDILETAPLDCDVNNVYLESCDMTSGSYFGSTSIINNDGITANSDTVSEAVGVGEVGRIKVTDQKTNEDCFGTPGKKMAYCVEYNNTAFDQVWISNVNDGTVWPTVGKPTRLSTAVGFNELCFEAPAAQTSGDVAIYVNYDADDTLNPADNMTITRADQDAYLGDNGAFVIGYENHNFVDVGHADQTSNVNLS